MPIALHSSAGEATAFLQEAASRRPLALPYTHGQHGERPAMLSSGPTLHPHRARRPPGFTPRRPFSFSPNHSARTLAGSVCPDSRRLSPQWPSPRLPAPTYAPQCRNGPQASITSSSCVCFTCSGPLLGHLLSCIERAFAMAKTMWPVMHVIPATDVRHTLAVPCAITAKSIQTPRRKRIPAHLDVRKERTKPYKNMRSACLGP